MANSFKSIYSSAVLSVDKLVEEQFENDLQCWRAFKLGNEAAFIQIYREFFHVLFNYGYQFVQDEDLIQDCIQDLFIDLRSNRKSLADTDNIKKYLFKCLKRKIIYQLKKKKADQLRYVKANQFEFEFSIEDNIISRQINDQRSHQVKEALAQLPSRQREALYYYYYENMNYSEVADIMKMSQTRSARNLIYRALGNLKVNLIIEFSSLFILSFLF